MKNNNGNMRYFLIAGVPTLAALLGFFWFRRKKKSIELKKEDTEVVSQEKTAPVTKKSDSVGSSRENVNNNVQGALSSKAKESVAPDTKSKSESNEPQVKKGVESQSCSKTPEVKSKAHSSPAGAVAAADLVSESFLLSSTSQSLSSIPPPSPPSHLEKKSEDCSAVSRTVESPAPAQVVSSLQTKSEVISPSKAGADTKADEAFPSSDTCPSSDDSGRSSEKDFDFTIEDITMSKPQEDNMAEAPISKEKVGELKCEAQEELKCEKQEEMKCEKLEVLKCEKQEELKSEKKDESRVRKSSGKEDLSEETTLVAGALGGEMKVDVVGREGSCDSAVSLTSPTSPINGVAGAECAANGDANSEVSNDSGRGPSLASMSLPDYVLYEFDFPTDLCGRLIGKQGKNISVIKSKSGAEISVKRKPFVRDFQICSINGTQSQINSALDLIKKKFPEKHFPEINYEQVNIACDAPVLSPEIMQLSLPEGVSVDVIVSSVVDTNHVFIQQPTHPTFPSLERLSIYMNTCYGQEQAVVPELPRPIEVGVICSAPMYNGWYRAQVVEVLAETDECDIKFVDYGGYMRVPGSALRQIRSDFTSLPFQATECYLANVIPPKDDEGFPVEAAAVLESLVQGKLLQAQIVAHEEDGVPYIQLYDVQRDQTIFVNRELVNSGVARWIEMSV